MNGQQYEFIEQFIRADQMKGGHIEKMERLDRKLQVCLLFSLPIPSPLYYQRSFAMHSFLLSFCTLSIHTFHFNSHLSPDSSRFCTSS